MSFVRWIARSLSVASSLGLASASAFAQVVAPAEPPAQPPADPPAAQSPQPAVAPAVSAPATNTAPQPTVAPTTAIYAVQAPSSTARYRFQSWSLLGGATLGAGYSPAINTTAGADLSAAAEVRFVFRGIVVAGSLGAKVTGVSLPMAPTAAAVGVLIVPGIGGGYQLGLTPSLSLGAVVRYNATILASSTVSASHTISADVPLTIHVGNNGLIEPFVQAGVGIGGVSTTGGSATSTQVTALVLGGVRFGLTL